MFLPFVQVSVAALLISYAGYCVRQQRKRRRRSWYEIMSQLRGNDWGIEEVTESYLYKSGVLATTEDIWERIAGCEGLMAMYKNAPVLVQLADYAAEHGQGVDEKMLEGLRTDAFHIRLCVMMALAQHVMSASSVGASVNAHRATVTYTEMLARLTAFIQEHSASLFPSYLDAIA
jgi:hypothetical protein